MNKKFLIVTPPYRDNVGGIIVLHKLCDILNNIGYEAYLHPAIDSKELRPHKKIISTLKYALMYLHKSRRVYKKKYDTNPFYNTPVRYQPISKDEENDWVVIYPEVTFGNPLSAKNVIRWLLHQPGFHTGKVCYGSGELYFKFIDAFKDPNISGSKTSEKNLKIVHFPTEYYNLENTDNNREGVAYCIRKGNKKTIVHDTEKSILIDGMCHEEIARIFKKTKTFISYDSYTAYSKLAVLCGCESIVIPDENVTEIEWRPNIEDRYGISYGLENIDWSKKTAHLLIEKVKEEHNKSEQSVKDFVQEALNYFSDPI